MIDIFTAPAAITKSGFEIWLAASSDDPNYGGCFVWASDDNLNYARIGKINGNSRHGQAINNIPASSTEYDNSHRVRVQLWDGQSLINGTDADLQNDNMLFLLGEEVVGYRDSALVAANTWELFTLRRSRYNTNQMASKLLFDRNTPGDGLEFANLGCYGKGLPSVVASLTTTSGTGTARAQVLGSHDSVSWIVISDLNLLQNGDASLSRKGVSLPKYYPYLKGRLVSITGTGAEVRMTYSQPTNGQSFVRMDEKLLKYPFDPARIGLTMYFKFQPFNAWENGLLDLSEVESYQHTIAAPLGVPLPPTAFTMSQASPGAPVKIQFAKANTSNIRWYELRAMPVGSILDWDAATVLIESVMSHPFDTVVLPPGRQIFMLVSEDAGAKYSTFAQLDYTVL